MECSGSEPIRWRYSADSRKTLMMWWRNGCSEGVSSMMPHGSTARSLGNEIEPHTSRPFCGHADGDLVHAPAGSGDSLHVGRHRAECNLTALRAVARIDGHDDHQSEIVPARPPSITAECVYRKVTEFQSGTTFGKLEPGVSCQYIREQQVIASATLPGIAFHPAPPFERKPNGSSRQTRRTIAWIWRVLKPVRAFSTAVSAGFSMRLRRRGLPRIRW